MSDQLRRQHFYSISLHHVQLALKYSRMKATHQDYQRNTLKQLKIHTVGSPIIKTFTAKLKIVNARFILLATHILYAGPVRDASTKDLNKFITFCPHHYFGLGTTRGYEFAAVLQKAAISAQTTQGPHTELFSCERCPTDYSVVVEGDEAVVKAWYDLGNGSSVKDPTWQSHLFSANNGVFEGITVDHEYGSIARLYDSCNA